MISGRRIAAAALTAVLSVGAVALTAGTAGSVDARTDTSWPEANSNL